MKWALVIVGIVVAILIGVGIYFLMRKKPEKPTTPANPNLYVNRLAAAANELTELAATFSTCSDLASEYETDIFLFNQQKELINAQRERLDIVYAKFIEAWVPIKAIYAPFYDEQVYTYWKNKFPAFSTLYDNLYGIETIVEQNLDVTEHTVEVLNTVFGNLVTSINEAADNTNTIVAQMKVASNDCSTGLENIKAERDRLKVQVQDYDKYVELQTNILNLSEATNLLQFLQGRVSYGY